VSQKGRTVGLGLFAMFVVVTTIDAQNPPATDGLKFGKDQPSVVTVGVPPPNSWIAASGSIDTTKYANGKVSGTVCFMEVWVLDKDGKTVGDPQVFMGKANPDDGPNGSWSVVSDKLYDKKKEVQTKIAFPGFPTGKYKIKIEVSIKETPTSTARPAYIEATVDIPPQDGGGGGSLTPFLDSQPWYMHRRSRMWVAT